MTETNNRRAAGRKPRPAHQPPAAGDGDSPDAAGGLTHPPAGPPPDPRPAAAALASTSDRRFGSNRKLDHILSEAERAEYEVQMRTPGTTIKDLRAWLHARGHSAAMTTVRRHRFEFRRQLRNVRDAAELAHVFLQLARPHGPRPHGGPGELTDAAATFAESQMLRSMFNVLRAQEAGEFDAGAWEGVFKMLGLSAKSRETIERLRAIAPAARRAGKPAEPPQDGAPTPAAAAAAAPAADRAAALARVALLVREAMGVPPPSDADDEAAENGTPTGPSLVPDPDSGTPADG